MIIETSTQVYLILWNFLAGILTGVLFDIHRIIRGNNKCKTITFIQDILFWILVSVIVFIFLVYTKYAYFGLYCYVHIIIGLIVYLKAFSKYCKDILSSIFKNTSKIFRVIFNYILYFVNRLLQLIIKK